MQQEASTFAELLKNAANCSMTAASWSAGHCALNQQCMQERAVPTLVSLLQEPDKIPDGLIAGAVDLISTLMAPASVQQAQRMHQALTSLVIQLAETSSDPEIIRSCCTYLRCNPQHLLHTLVVCCQAHCPRDPAEIPPTSI